MCKIEFKEVKPSEKVRVGVVDKGGEFKGITLEAKDLETIGYEEGGFYDCCSVCHIVYKLDKDKMLRKVKDGKCELCGEPDDGHHHSYQPIPICSNCLKGKC